MLKLLDYYNYLFVPGYGHQCVKADTDFVVALAQTVLTALFAYAKALV
jgi:hypothetical protein